MDEFEKRLPKPSEVIRVRKSIDDALRVDSRIMLEVIN